MGQHGRMLKVAASILHPRRDDCGREVRILRPSTASPVLQWRDPAAIAVVVPDGTVVEGLHGVPFEPWSVPAGAVGAGVYGGEVDSALNGALNGAPDGVGDFEEPPFAATAGLAPAAGVVVIEPDDRIWAVAPTNGFGGYSLTFPNCSTRSTCSRADAPPSLKRPRRSKNGRPGPSRILGRRSVGRGAIRPSACALPR
jgi:hypothetical protein